jgi:hypothetical protein
MAESYLQHAEHYFRLIAAAQQAQQQTQTGFQRQPGDPEPEDTDDDDEGGIPDRFASPFERQQPAAPPPAPFYPPQNGQPTQQPYAERPYNDQPRQDRPFQDRNNQPRQDRPYQDRNNNYRNNTGPNRNPRDQRPPRDFRNDQPRYEPRADQRPPAQPQPQPVLEEAAPGLPSFITAPVRATTSEGEPPVIVNEAPVQDAGEAEAGRFHLRNRRRRRPVAGAEAEGGANEAASDKAPVGE